MECPGCGKEIDTRLYCPNCGLFPQAKPHLEHAEQETKPEDRNRIASAGLLVVGIAWVFALAGSIVGMILAVVGIVLGAIGLAKSTGRGHAVAALLGGTLLLLMFKLVATVSFGTP